MHTSPALKERKPGAHYQVAVLCDKWEHADNTFA